MSMCDLTVPQGDGIKTVSGQEMLPGTSGPNSLLDASSEQKPS